MFCPFYPPMDKSSLLFAGTMSTKGDSSGAFQLKHRSGTANVFNEEVMTQAAFRLGLVKPSWLSPCQPPWNEGRWFKKLLVWVCLNMNYPFLFHVFMLSQWLSFSVSSYLFCVGSHMFNKTFWESTPLLGKAMNRIWCRFQFSLNPMDFELRIATTTTCFSLATATTCCLWLAPDYNRVCACVSSMLLARKSALTPCGV